MTGRVLVTGASGFIGRPLVKSLVEAGWSVIGAARGRPQQDPGVADWIEIDLLTEDPCTLATAANAETLIHLAWIATPGVYAHSLENLDWLRASTALSAAFLAGGGRRLVGAGTCLEYDLDHEGDGTTGPRTLYAAAKHACRLAFEHQVSATHGASLAWPRIFFLLGAEDHPDRLAPGLARRLAAGEAAEISQGLVERDFIDVRDAARAIAALAGSEASGAFDIASGHGWRLRDLAEAIAKAAGRPDLLRINPALDRAAEPPRLVGDPKPLMLATGYSPLYSIDQSIADLLRRREPRSSNARHH
jgi:nucleoside-diphosphate-sugar epimerase